MNNRRKILVALGAGALTAPLASFAQLPGKVWRIGFIWASSQSIGQRDLNVVLRRLRELGHVEGRDFTAEHRWADGNPKLLDGFAAELVRLKVDLIVTRSTPAALAVKSATQTIPVVFAMVSDPVASGIVSSLARPGGNLTGWSNMLPDTTAKLLELLKAVTPGMSRLAVLADASNPAKVLEITALQKATSGLGLTLRTKELRSVTDIDAAFAQMSREGTNALIVLVDAVTLTNRQRIVEFAAKNHLPAIYQAREFVDAGGLMSYGMNISQQQERTAEYIHRIFKGAKPADLPIERPTKFELIINRKAAKALALSIPQSLLMSADQVIE